MNKRIKAFLFTLLFLILSLIMFINVISAQLDSLEGIQEKLDELPSDQDEAEEAATAYLKKEWSKILERSQIGGILSSSENLIKKADPLFNFFFNTGFSWNFLFFILVSLWIFFVSWLYSLLTFLSIFIRIKFFNILLFIVSVVIVSFTAFSKTIALFFVNVIAKINNLFLQIISALVLIIFILVLSVYSGHIKKLFSSMKENRRKAYLEKEVRKEKKEIKQLKKEGVGSKEVEGGRFFLREIYRALMKK